MSTGVPLRKPDIEHQRIYERIISLDARIMALQTEMKQVKEELQRHREAIAYIRTCFATPNVKKELDRLVGPETKPC